MLLASIGRHWEFFFTVDSGLLYMCIKFQLDISFPFGATKLCVKFDFCEFYLFKIQKKILSDAP